MPKVGGRHYPYTKEGRAVAKKAKQQQRDKKGKKRGVRKVMLIPTKA